MPRPLLPVIAVTLFLCFFRLGSVTLFDVDEAVFATATKEMVGSGDWITPTYNGENRYDKPILFYWLMAVPYLIFGVNEFSARFPSAVSALLLVPVVFLFVARFKDERSALYAGTSLALSIYFFIYSHAAVTDMALTLFITLSLVSLFLALSERERSPRADIYLYGFYFFSALAFLTKGLIGIVFPFGIGVVFLFITEGASSMKKLFSVRGVLIFLLVAAPWYLAQLTINGKEFFQQFFMKHHFMRYTGVISGHKGPFYYYIPALIIGLFPWVAFLPGGIFSAFRTRDRFLLFAFSWVAFVVLFFSLSTTKLPNYILPAVPAAAILISEGMSVDGRLGRFALILIAGMSLFLGAAFVVSRPYLLKFGVLETGWTIMAATVMFGLTAVCFFAFLIRKRLYPIIAGITATFLVIFSLEMFPLASKYMQETLFRYSVYAKERLGARDGLITYGINHPSIVFYSGHKVINAGSREELGALLKSGVNLIAISKSKDVELLRELGFNLLETEGKYAILEKRT